MYGQSTSTRPKVCLLPCVSIAEKGWDEYGWMVGRSVADQQRTAAPNTVSRTPWTSLQVPSRNQKPVPFDTIHWGLGVAWAITKLLASCLYTDYLATRKLQVPSPVLNKRLPLN